jgi:DNA-binding Xre family transcriptional regulator
MMNEQKKMDKTKVVRKTRFTRLKKILMDRNITQTELSRLTGIPAYKISLITSGRTNNLYMTTAKKICEVLQVNLDDAFGDIVNG